MLDFAPAINAALQSILTLQDLGTLKVGGMSTKRQAVCKKLSPVQCIVSIRAKLFVSDGSSLLILYLHSNNDNCACGVVLVHRRCLAISNVRCILFCELQTKRRLCNVCKME